MERKITPMIRYYIIALSNGAKSFVNRVRRCRCDQAADSSADGEREREERIIRRDDHRATCSSNSATRIPLVSYFSSSLPPKLKLISALFEVKAELPLPANFGKRRGSKNINKAKFAEYNTPFARKVSEPGVENCGGEEV